MTNEVYASGGAGDPYISTHLITGEKSPVNDTVTAKAGVTIARYALVGIDTNNFALLSASAAVDGSQTPVGIAAYAVDATAGAVDFQIYTEGCFNPNLIVFGAGHTAASVRNALRARGIYLKAPA
jgi:hypothetical protein